VLKPHSLGIGIVPDPELKHVGPALFPSIPTRTYVTVLAEFGLSRSNDMGVGVVRNKFGDARTTSSWEGDLADL